MSWLSPPMLPSGYNSTDINGDEMNGPGINFPIWPVLFDAYEPMTPMIITTIELDVFNGCADYTVPGENRTVNFPPEVREIMIRGSR